jgi:hypothetical protein
VATAATHRHDAVDHGGKRHDVWQIRCGKHRWSKRCTVAVNDHVMF